MNLSLAKEAVRVERKYSAGAMFRRGWARHGILIFLLLLLAVSGVASPAFLKPGNITNMLLQVSPLAIVVIGQVFVILVRGLDLSVASVMATAAVIATGFDGKPDAVAPIIVTTLGMTIAVGLLNGLLVTKRNVSPFLATFATMVLLHGIRFAYTHGAPSGNVPEWFKVLGNGTVSGIPYNLMVLCALAAVLGVLLHMSAFGRQIYVVGGNPTAARLVGFHADRVTITCYVISAVLAGIAGLILAGYVGIVDNFVGRGMELDSIVAAVIGGVSLSGGRGRLLGALMGAAVLVVVFNIVLLVGFPVQVQIIIKGVVIVAASAFYVSRRA